MTTKQFIAAINESKIPPADLHPYLQSLWLAKTRQWNAAHDMVDSENHADACWIHAFLHREEGDPWNARYWYHRAGKPQPTVSLDDEWLSIASALLKQYT